MPEIHSKNLVSQSTLFSRIFWCSTTPEPSWGLILTDNPHIPEILDPSQDRLSWKAGTFSFLLTAKVSHLTLSGKIYEMPSGLILKCAYT